MGLLATVAGPLGDTLANKSTWVIVGAGVLAVFVLSIILNILTQLWSKNPNEPPLVFHWVPFFGSTIVYGIDPYAFFFRCQKKVGVPRPYSLSVWMCGQEELTEVVVWRCLHLRSSREKNHGLPRNQRQ